MKLAVVGAGSTYTPELVSGLARRSTSIALSELVLHDTDPDRLAVVGAFARRMLEHAGVETSLRLSTDLVSAVSDASVVLIQLRVGGQAARLGDETFPLECGCVGQETTGAGGLAKALRTVPVVLDVADAVRRHASPDAWIVDFTNPVGIVTRALLQEGHRAIGLCNVAIGFERLFAEWLDSAPQDIHLDHAGLNHLTWIRGVRLGEREVLPELLRTHGEEIAERVELPRAIIDRLDAIPSYYLRYFYAHDEVVDELRRDGTRAAAVAVIERELLEMYADPALVEKPALLDQRGGAYYSEAAVALVASLLGDDGAEHVCNVRNDGTLAFLPDDHVIEVPCRVDAKGASAFAVPPFDERIRGLVAHVADYERLALEAALRGSRTAVADALLAHPLVGQWEQAEQLTDLLIAGNRDHLPWAT